MNVPFTKGQIEAWAKEFPTPFYIYDERAIRQTIHELLAAFSDLSFTEYFAVKATPNPAILRIMQEEGCGADCSSMAELLLAEHAGITGERIMFSSNNTTVEEFKKAIALGAIINLDAPDLLEYLEEHAGLPRSLCLRYNPGGDMGNSIIGKPVDSKFGMTREQLVSTLHRAKAKGVQRLGIHCMTASNMLNADFFGVQARMIFSLVLELKKEGVIIDFVNFGGGIGIPYRPEEKPLAFAHVAAQIRAAKQELDAAGIHLDMCMELGRAITGPHGYLVTRVRHMKKTHKHYAGVDATMANLMRPGMYGAYHHITVLGKEGEVQQYDVVGSLCENNDKFAVDRPLPHLETGDILVIHDAGAHGHAMGFNYNGKLRCAELLLHDGAVRIIRRAETLDDYFATLVGFVEKYS